MLKKVHKRLSYQAAPLCYLRFGSCLADILDVFDHCLMSAVGREIKGHFRGTKGVKTWSN